MDYLYENFLSNHHIYNLNIGYWSRIIKKTSGGLAGESYLTTKFNNGRAFLNGNPIFNIYYSEIDKAIRIVQDTPEELGDFYSSYTLLEGNEYLGTPPELSIILTLTRGNIEKAKKDINLWLKTES